jgi:hypothetical protein
MILRGLVGSTIHGLANAGTDDRDEMAVCIEPPDYVIGLRTFEHYVTRGSGSGRLRRGRRPRITHGPSPAPTKACSVLSENHHSASRTLTTNQPWVTGVSPDPKSSSCASGTAAILAPRDGSPMWAGVQEYPPRFWIVWVPRQPG